MLEKLDTGDGSIRYERYINVRTLADLLNQLPENNFVLTNRIGNLVIFEQAEVLGYIDLGNEKIELFDTSESQAETIRT